MQGGIPSVIIIQKCFSLLHSISSIPVLFFSFFLNHKNSPKNTISYIFQLFFSLSFLLLWRTEGEKSIQYRAIDPPITAEKKSVQGATQFRLDTAIDNILYQPFPWQLAECEDRGCHVFCTCLFHIPIVIMKVSGK